MPELRRLLHLLHESEEQRTRQLWWSRFRRRHQAGAKRAHIAWRAAQRPAPSLAPWSAQQVLGLKPLSDELWGRQQGLFVVPPHTPGRHQVDYRLIVEGILWIIRTARPGVGYRRASEPGPRCSTIIGNGKEMADGHNSNRPCKVRKFSSAHQLEEVSL